MVGIVGSADAKVFTWFGNNPEYVHGINMMPFTPITEELLRKDYVKEEYPILEPRLEDVADQWLGIIELAHAVLDPAAAFEVPWTPSPSLRPSPVLLLPRPTRRTHHRHRRLAAA